MRFPRQLLTAALPLLGLVGFAGCDDDRPPPRRVIVEREYYAEPGYYYEPEYYDSYRYYHPRIYYYYDGRRWEPRDRIPAGAAARERRREHEREEQREHERR